MQVNNILSRSHDSRTHGKRADPVEATAAAALGRLVKGSDSGRQNSAVGSILGQYDVTNITPQEFSQMVQKLRDSGALSDAELRELNQVRADLDRSGVQPGERVNLVDFYQQKQHDLQAEAESTQGTPESTTAQQSLSSVSKRLNWVEKFATMHHSSDAVGLSMMA